MLVVTACGGWSDIGIDLKVSLTLAVDAVPISVDIVYATGCIGVGAGTIRVVLRGRLTGSRLRRITLARILVVDPVVVVHFALAAGLLLRRLLGLCFGRRGLAAATVVGLLQLLFCACLSCRCRVCAIRRRWQRGCQDGRGLPCADQFRL